MFSFLKKPKLPSSLIVIAGLFSLLLFGILSFVLIVNVNYKNSPKALAGDRYWLKNEAAAYDPMVTKNPDLRDILAGPIISDRDPSLGSAQSPITIVIYSDFTCKYCHDQEIVLQNLLVSYQDKIRLIWKDYPEKEYESPSYQAALAARCSSEQNMFWPYHDLLFQTASTLDSKTLYSIAENVGLNTNIFKDCMASGRTKKYIEDNIVEANILEISGVPFIYLNDQEIIGQASLADLESMVKLELSKQSRL